MTIIQQGSNVWRCKCVYCPDCDGKGYLGYGSEWDVADTCPTCKGDGRTERCEDCKLHESIRQRLHTCFYESLTDQQKSLYKYLTTLHVEFIGSDATHRHLYRVDKHVNENGPLECASVGGACVLLR